MVSRAPADSYLDRHSGHADNYYNNYNHRMMRDERSWGVSRSEHSRNRYYQPTPRRERTPSPPREYIYGVRRQREWQSAYPEEEEEPDYDIQPYPEEEEEYRPYEQDRRANEYYQEEEERRRRYEQERRWQEQEEEEDRRRWEAEERYRRWEEEELRRYQEENRQRKEQQRRAEEQAQKRKQQEELAQQRQLLLQAQANKNKSKKSELLRPAPIPKPPPPHPGFEATHNPSLWALTKKAQSLLLATAGDDDKTLKSGSHHSSRHNNSSHHSSSVKISTHNSIPKDSWSPPYPYYTSEHSERKPLHKCKTIPSDDSYYYERKEPPVYPSGAPSLKRDTSSHSGQVGAFSEKSYHSPPKSPVQLKTAAAIKKDSASTISSKSQSVSPNKKKSSSMLVEIQPGFCLPLRGSQDTLAAVAMGKVLPTPCLSCGCWIVVRDDCDFVICPDCRVVSPVEGGYGTMQYVGLGMSQSVHDATLARMCTSARF